MKSSTGKKSLNNKELEGSCIYFLYKGEEVVYIGQTFNFPQRLISHIQRMARERKNGEEFEFDAYETFPCEEEKLNTTEAQNILKHSPKYNRDTKLFNPIKGLHKIGYASNSKELTKRKYTITIKVIGDSIIADFRQTEIEYIKKRTKP